jgi:hypothetical protein
VARIAELFSAGHQVTSITPGAVTNSSVPSGSLGRIERVQTNGLRLDGNKLAAGNRVQGGACSDWQQITEKTTIKGGGTPGQQLTEKYREKGI